MKKFLKWILAGILTAGSIAMCVSAYGKFSDSVTVTNHISTGDINISMKELEKKIGYTFENHKLLERAMMHSSYTNEKHLEKYRCNERLEFLGDGILDAAVADIVYKRYPNKREGFLTNTRSKIVQRETMNKVAVQLGLDQMVVYSTKINSHNNHMYGNALEALIGAIYLDQGYDVCYKFIRDVMIEKYIDVDTLVRKEIYFKSNLIEWSQ